ncbi:DMP19 family protein [Rhizobium sp. LjRoot254]|uniref:DMP19 family protein n=1 Tax=Rhizobium sp. LjRoot254 TaxID=3342297 RepID=UPI003ECF99E3
MPASTQLVFIPASLADGSADSFDTVLSVLDYADAMLGRGYYEPEELPSKVMQLSGMNEYYGEVMNGGHLQFIDNAQDKLGGAIRQAKGGFSAMGATGYLSILLELETWLNANGFQEGQPFEGGEFDHDPEAYLDQLDDRLYQLDQTYRMHDVAARWLLGWDNLRIVEDEKLQAIRDAQVMVNPLRIPRQIRRRISRFEQRIGDSSTVGLALAVASISRRETFLEIVGGRPRMTDGKASMLWLLRTSNGERLGVSHEDGAEIFSSEEVDFYSSNYDAPLRRRLGYADRRSIDAVLAYDGLDAVAVSADMLLRKHHPDLEEKTFLAPALYRDGQPPIFSLCAGNKQYMLSEAEDGFTVTDINRDEAVERIRHEDIEAYLNEVKLLESDAEALPSIH